MKKTYLLLFLLLSAICSLAQTTHFPDGIYLNFDQLHERTPAYNNVELQVIRRSQGDISFNGGNDYELISNIDSIDKKYLKKVIYAYCSKDTLYLNCLPHQLQSWYAQVLTYGNFLAFKAGISNDKAMQQSYGGFGAIGGAIGGMKMAKLRYLYVLSLRTGNVKLLTPAYLKERLKEFPDLAALYEKETEENKTSENILLFYIKAINKKLAE